MKGYGSGEGNAFCLPLSDALTDLRGCAGRALEIALLNRSCGLGWDDGSGNKERVATISRPLLC